jgi:hypothetical protein
MASPHERDDSLWFDDEAGPVVRPYAMTHGRTEPVAGTFDLLAFVVATAPVSLMGTSAVPEHASIVELCQQPTTVAEVAAHLNLPLGTVRVLLGDLLDRGLVMMREQQAVTELNGEDLFRAVIDGLRAL